MDLEGIKILLMAIIAMTLVGIFVKIDTKEKSFDSRAIYYQRAEARSLQMIANAMHPGKLEILNLGQPQCGKNQTYSLIETAELTNPNFPDSFNAGTKCIWKISRPLGFQVKISFPKYNVSNHSETQSESQYV